MAEQTTFTRLLTAVHHFFRRHWRRALIIRDHLRLSEEAFHLLLAGVIGGNAFVTEPGMAATVGSVIFVVVVVGGMGSLAGAFLASLLIGIVQTFAVAMDQSMAGGLQALGLAVNEGTFGYPLLKLTISQVAPILPYLFLVLILIFRPKGLLGTRED